MDNLQAVPGSLQPVEGKRQVGEDNPHSEEGKLQAEAGKMVEVGMLQAVVGIHLPEVDKPPVGEGTPQAVVDIHPSERGILGNSFLQTQKE